MIVTNLIEHQNFGDLVGTLSFGGQYAVLNNHDGFGNTSSYIYSTAIKLKLIMVEYFRYWLLMIPRDY